MPAQYSNILLNGDPNSPIYQAAYNEMAQPKTTFDATTNQMISVTPDMSAYRPPAESATGQPPKVQLPKTPPGQPTVSYEDGRGRTKPYNDAQNKASGFYSRMLSANTAMGGVLAGEDGIQGTADDVKYDDVNSLNQTMKNAVPFFGNTMISNERQQLQQAQENWVSAVLRRESGAVLGDDEIVRENKKYFPQYGDSKKNDCSKSSSEGKGRGGDAPIIRGRMGSRSREKRQKWRWD